MSSRSTIKERIASAKQSMKKWNSHEAPEVDEKGLYYALLYDYNNKRLCCQDKIELFNELHEKYGTKNRVQI